ncbi:MAG: replicative DNA helicase [Pirellulaceae bacterium]|nr:replicative DNA helicase [Pirellulaceae bacterium]
MSTNQAGPGTKKFRPKKKPELAPHQILDREQPFNLEAEVGVLGSILLMPELCDEIVSIVRPEDFYDPAHEKLFHHIRDMHGSGLRIDLTLLRARLESHGDFEAIGGASQLAHIFTSVPTPAHAKFYAKIVQEKATLRQLIATCTDLMTAAYLPNDKPMLLLDQAESQVLKIRESRQGNSLMSLDQCLELAINRLEAKARGEGLAGTVETGFKDLDNLLGGLHGSELLIIAARPSMGKTAFALNIAEHVAIEVNRPVLFISLEMAAIELTERMLCSLARVNGHRLRNGSLRTDDRKRLIRMAAQINKAKLFIDDSHSQTLAEIAATARRIKRRENDLSLIVIDYLQLIEPENSQDPRQEQVAKIARRLKGLAKELAVPVVCLAQLNRQAEDTRDHRPKLSHLRESGAIEQDADVVMFVHRKDYYKSGDDSDAENEGKAQIIVAKQRNGPVGDIDLAWLKDFTRFANLAEERFNEFDQPVERQDFSEL